MYDRILLPTDGSVEMEHVVDHAASLAAIHDATIHAIYVVDTGRFASLPTDNSWEGITQMLREEGELALDDVERFAEGVPVETAMVEGDPANEILDYAEENDCDVVLMGTHGRGGINRLLLGSVAERVVRRSPVPVITVPVRRADWPDESTSPSESEE
jgi:nucleotide-binding universal stress UspA family protein